MKKLAVLCGLSFAGVVSGQRGAGDWMTSGYDAQRSSWVRSDAKISPESMAKPGFQLVWKLKLENQARQLNSVTSPALLDFYIGYRGFRSLAFFSASSGKVIAVDSELARIEWENKYAPPNSSGTPACPGGMTAAVTRPTITAYPSATTGRGFGRGTPAKSGVGAPHEGSVVLSAMASRPAPGPPPSMPRPARGAEVNPFAPHVQYALALTGDGKLHSLWVSNGNEPAGGMNFIPPDARALGLIAYDNTAYVATAGNCGGAGNGIWSLDLTTRKVNHWKSSKEIAGTAGPAVGPDGTLYVAAGDEIVALSPGQLETVAVHRGAGVEFSSTPVVFEFKGKNLLAVASSDGRLNLLDTASLSDAKPLARTEPFSGSGYAAGALASWQDPAGTRWILAPASGAIAAGAQFPATNGQVSNGSIIAWKVVDKNGSPEFEPGWASRDLTSALPPVVVNGVVFALSSGEFVTNDANMPAAERASKSKPAVLYALDGRSGKELWNSGTTITSFVHSGGLAAGGSRVYVSDYDGVQYAFGFPIEH